ncbi:MAG: hypothetical protein BGN97_15955 [Microbacterium sp. 69-10]|nr:MAG: hypothetical protein BGN97_15955 [Microbacterium sp. 69-10]
MRTKKCSEHRRRSLIGVVTLTLALIASLLPAPSASAANSPGGNQYFTTGSETVPGANGSDGIEPSPLDAGNPWVATWTASPNAAKSGSCQDCTIRNVLRTTAAGDKVRVHLSNDFNSTPMTISASSVALSATPGSADVAEGTLRPLTFDGERSITIPPYGQVVSDVVQLEVPSDSDLLVTTFAPGAQTGRSYHAKTDQTQFHAVGTNVVDATAASAFPLSQDTWYFVTAVDVSGGPARGTVVTFGDSITDSGRPTRNANRRYPNFLARRILAEAPHAQLAVANAGISGNQLLTDAAAGAQQGPAGVSRFARDVLGVTGVTTAIVLEGTNDLARNRTAPEIITGLQSVIAEARAAGVKVIGGTILPFEGGTIWQGITPAMDVQREAVNEWIRTSGAFDDVIDFDLAMRDPANPKRLLPAYDSGDRVHPNDAGNAAMAAAVDLTALVVPGGSAVTFSASGVRTGEPSTWSATVANLSSTGTIDSANLTLNVPDGIVVESPSVSFEDIAPGTTQTATWRVSAAGFPKAFADVSLSSTVVVEGDIRHDESSERIMVGAESAAPWQTYSTEPGAEFAFASAQIGLRTTGRDFSKASRYFSAAYQPGVLADGASMVTHVDFQDSEGARPWARSGLMVSTGVATVGSPMAVLALTPSNGCALTWNSKSTGSLDTHRNNATFTGSAWLRMDRVGSTFIGSCSQDGQSWTTIGTATPTGFDASPSDAGVFSSAVNSGGADSVVAGFSKWAVRTVAAPRAWAAVDGRTVSLTAAADGIELSRIEYMIADGAWQTYAEPVTAEGVDAVSISYRAVDSRGVTGPVGTIKVANADSTTAAGLEALGTAKTVLTGDQAGGIGARVVDAAGGPVVGARVTFTASGGEFAGGVAEATALTNAAGIAVAPLVSSSAAGVITVTAGLAGNLVELPTVTVTAPASALHASVSASTRAVSGKVVVTVDVVNESEEPVSLKVATRYGTKSVAQVAAGESVSFDFKTYLAAIPAGTATVTMVGSAGTSSAAGAYEGR